MSSAAEAVRGVCWYGGQADLGAGGDSHSDWECGDRVGSLLRISRGLSIVDLELLKRIDELSVHGATILLVLLVLIGSSALALLILVFIWLILKVQLAHRGPQVSSLQVQMLCSAKWVARGSAGKGGTHRIINHPNDQRATGTSRDILTIPELCPRDLEAIATRAWVVKDTLDIVPSHVLDFDFIIVGTHRIDPTQ